MNLKITVCFVILFISVSFLKISQAEIVNAASVNISDVRTALVIAAPGDTILLPTGSSIWNESLKIEKSIYILGSGRGNTIISDNTSGNFRDEPFYITLGNDEFFEISDITFRNTDGFHGYWGVIYLTGSQQDMPKFRIHHSMFDSINGRVIWVDTVYGLIDSCMFDECGGQEFYVEGDGNNAFNRPEGLGSGNAVYFESNILYNSTPGAGLVDYDNGARLVIRYNDITNRWIMSHGYHDRTASARGACYQEIYENKWDATYNDCSHWILFRGGSGVIFNNIVTETGNGHWGWNNSRGISFCYYGLCPSGGDCGSLDNQGPRCTEYPCMDQPGYYGTIQSPIYMWGNTFPDNFINHCSTSCSGGQDCDGSPTAEECGGGTDVEECFIRENRDYYMGVQKPGYQPYIYPHPLTENVRIIPLQSPENLRIRN